MAKGNNMPSIAQETTNTSPSSVSCKKRRRDDDRDNSQQFTFSHHSSNNNNTIYPDNHQHHHHHHGGSSNLSPLATTARKMIPLSKRQRMTSVDTVDIEIDPKRQHDVAPHTNTKSPTHQREGEPSPAKPRPNLGSRAATTITTTTSLLTPCHICSRKPTKKSDLDSFADCQGCGQRTCYVCIRECLGWSPTRTPSLQTEPSITMIDVDSEEQQQQPPHPPVPESDPEDNGWAKGGGGHRMMVCSRCCVERGADGDVVCLGCLPFVEG